MNPRLAAARALAAVLEGKASLGTSLPPLLDRVEARDRGLAQDLAFGAARWQPRLALIADKLLRKPFKDGDRDLEALLLVGEAMALLAAALEQKVNVVHVADAGAALGALTGIVRTGDAVLVKGSNSVGLARVVTALRGEA